MKHAIGKALLKPLFKEFFGMGHIELTYSRPSVRKNFIPGETVFLAPLR